MTFFYPKGNLVKKKIKELISSEGDADSVSCMLWSIDIFMCTNKIVNKTLHVFYMEQIEIDNFWHRCAHVHDIFRIHFHIQT